MQVARLFSKRATCQRGQVGAILIREYRILASGYNGPAKGQPHCIDHGCDLSQPCTHAIHAEANLLAFCAKYGIPTNGGTMFITTAPCQKCSELIIQSGIKAIVYDSDYRYSDGIKLLMDANITIIKYDKDIKIPNEIYL